MENERQRLASQELSFIIVGSSVQEDSFWTLEHLSAKIQARKVFLSDLMHQAQHGYTAESRWATTPSRPVTRLRCFKDLLSFLSQLSPENRS